MTKIDTDRLTEEIRSLKRTHKLYRVLRDELGALGFWRAKARGNPSAGGKAKIKKLRERGF